jgi:hypothetical protein
MKKAANAVISLTANVSPAITRALAGLQHGLLPGQIGQLLLGRSRALAASR